MKSTFAELASHDIDSVSGGWDGDTFLQGLGYAALGAVAIASLLN